MARPSVGSLQASTGALAAAGLKGVISDNSGILSQMTARQANALLRYVMTKAAYAWHGRFARSRFTDRIHRAPFNYPFDRSNPLKDSGRLMRQFIARPSVKATATKRSKVSAKVSISTPPYANFRPFGKDLGSGQRRRSPLTINRYLRIIPAEEQEFFVEYVREALVEELRKTTSSSKTFRTGKKAGQTVTRTTLSARQARRILR